MNLVLLPVSAWRGAALDSYFTEGAPLSGSPSVLSRLCNRSQETGETPARLAQWVNS